MESVSLGCGLGRGAGNQGGGITDGAGLVGSDANEWV